MAYGIINGMILKIDKSGRIVVPKALRERLSLGPNSELEVLERAEGVLLRVVGPRPSMLNVEGLWVHQGTAGPNFDDSWAYQSNPRTAQPLICNDDDYDKKQREWSDRPGHAPKAS